MTQTIDNTAFNELVAPFATKLAEQYSTRRPDYPHDLMKWLATVAPSTARAWDAGTGSGQVAVGLADHFDHVTASDANAELLACAKQHQRIDYRRWRSEAPKLVDGSVDLVTSAMAAHWFETDRFYEEARRVLRPGGVIAIFGFYFFEIDDGIGDLVKQWHHNFAALMPEPLQVLSQGYERMPFPFSPIDTPDFALEATWTIDQMCRFIDQWVIVKHAREAGLEPMDALEPTLRRRWGNRQRRVRWPIFMRAAIV